MGRYYDRIWNKEKRRGGRRSSSKDNLCLDGRCKKHPGHCQSPGVCSLCLHERLSHLQSSMWSRRPHRGGGASSFGSCASSISSSLPSFYSCSSATLTSSPSRNHRSDPVPVPEPTGKGSRPRLAFRFTGRRRTVASSSDTREEDLPSNDRDRCKKKSGHWWKLIHPGSKRLFHNNLS